MTKAAQRKVYNSKRWKATRNKQMFEHPLCAVCGKIAQEVDHIEPLIDGGEPYSFSNLQSLCRDDHFAKTRQENRARYVSHRSVPKMLGLLILVGPRGVGKSTVRTQLTRLLDCSSASPDDYDDGWAGVNSMLWKTDRAIIECCRLPKMLVGSLGPTTIVIRLEAPPDLLRRRLEQRSDIEGGDIPRLLTEAADQRVSFFSDVHPDHVVATDAPPDTLVETIRAMVSW